MSIEQEIYNKLVEQFGIGEICIKKHGKRASKTWLEFIEAALKLEASELYGFCGFSGSDNLNKYLKKEYPSMMFLKTKRGSYWSTFLTSLLDKKRCAKCGLVKALPEFSINTSKAFGIRYMCKTCVSKYAKDNNYIYNSYSAKRRATKLKATPKWADLEAIKEIYKNCLPGYHVDHEIPLQGELVCGLHVHKNLKPIPAAENLAKSNKYTIV